MVDVYKLLKEKERIQRLVTKHRKRLEEKEAEIRENCTHPKTKIKNEYTEGGYLNVAVYRDITLCEICGVELDRKVTYGSFA